MDLQQSVPLLRTVLDRMVTDALQVATYSRLLVTAQLREGAAPSVRPLVEKFVQEEDARESSMTGFVLVQERTVALFVESQPETVVSLMASLAEHMDTLFSSVRVIASTEDCPAPCFAHFLYLDTVVRGGVQVDLDKDVAGSLYGVYRRILQLAPALARTEEAQLSDAARVADVVTQRFADYLPSDEVLDTIARSDKVTSVEDFLDLFAAPVEFKSAEERACPPPRPLSMVLGD